MNLEERTATVEFQFSDAQENARKKQIENLVTAKLAGSGYPALERVEVEFDKGVLSLFGQVSSYFLKQMAQAVVADIEGVKRINNRIKVYNSPRLLPR